jgi:hypothetical protein
MTDASDPVMKTIKVAGIILMLLSLLILWKGYSSASQLHAILQTPRPPSAALFLTPSQCIEALIGLAVLLSLALWIAAKRHWHSGWVFLMGYVTLSFTAVTTFFITRELMRAVTSLNNLR